MKTVLAILFVAHLFFPANAFSQNEKNSNVNVLSHPSRVEIPDDLPFAIMETRTDKDLVTTEHLRFPAIDYQRAHFRSWQKCLRMTRDGGDQDCLQLCTRLNSVGQRRVSCRDSRRFQECFAHHSTTN